jgi:hypothetical protein
MAESATYVWQRRVKRDQEGEVVDLLFEVGTGELDADTTFAPHGHVLLIAVAGVVRASRRFDSDLALETGKLQRRGHAVACRLQ